MDFKNVLVLAPHTDDGELGAGGFLNKLILSGAKVTYVAFSTAVESLPEGLPEDTLEIEVGEATKSLGIKSLIVFKYPVRNFNVHRQDILDDLIKIRKNEVYDLVLIPSRCDVHQDHQVITNEAIRAFKNTTILGYELIWNSFEFKNDLYVSLDKLHVEAKIKALACYKSQNHRDYMSADYVNSLAYMRGLQVSKKYCECFEVIRWVIN